MGSLSPMLIVGAAVIVLGEILHIVGLATNGWVTGESGKVDFKAGLWEFCVGSTCYDLDSDINSQLWKKIDTEVEATRAMVILGMLCGLVGAAAVVVMAVFAILDKAANSLMPIVCLGATAAAFVFIIIGVIIFGAKTYEDEFKKSDYDLDYSFALCIVGGILLPIGGAIVMFMGGAKN